MKTFARALFLILPLSYASISLSSAANLQCQSHGQQRSLRTHRNRA